MTPNPYNEDHLVEQPAQELLRQGHTYLDSNGDGEACESLRH